MTIDLKKPEPGVKEAGSSAGAKKGYILVAEDDKFYANVYKVKLAKEGYEVRVVEDGEQALKALGEKKPDLLLLDLVMPVKDGFEVLEAINTKPKLKDIRVIVLSNLGQDEDIKRARDLGAKEYLVKTNLSIQQMMEKVKSHLK